MKCGLQRPDYSEPGDTALFLYLPYCCRAEPQVSEGITRAEWKDPDDLEEVFDCTYGNIKELLEACLNDRKSSRL